MPALSSTLRAMKASGRSRNLRIVTSKLDRVSPLAVPARLEISREMVARGEVDEDILRDNEDTLIADAMRVD